MDPDDLLAREFEEHRTHLRAVAYRMLGSVHEADDAVQEAWLRLARSDTSDVANLRGWLTTVVSRVCLDQLRTRTTRREAPLEGHEAAPLGEDARDHPEHEALLADSVGAALTVVLDTLAPAERLAFVLHDLFGLPFGEIGAVLGRSPAATRQLASRARRRVRGTPEDEIDAERQAQREVVEAFLAASRTGDLDRLLGLLDPDAVVRSDGAAVHMGTPEVVRGAAGVARTFSGRARAARLGLVDGYAGAVWSHEGKPRVAFGFTVVDGKVLEIELLADPDLLARLEPAARG
jgi:RNA polymerase sigma factor (sigma-70 family)